MTLIYFENSQNHCDDEDEGSPTRINLSLWFGAVTVAAGACGRDHLLAPTATRFGVNDHGVNDLIVHESSHGVREQLKLGLAGFALVLSGAEYAEDAMADGDEGGDDGNEYKLMARDEMASIDCEP